MARITSAISLLIAAFALFVALLATQSTQSVQAQMEWGQTLSGRECSRWEIETGFTDLTRRTGSDAPVPISMTCSVWEDEYAEPSQ